MMPLHPRQLTAALILAAGFSSRMGSIKALLPVGEYSALGHIAASYRRAGVETLLVVTGHEAARVKAESMALGMPTVHNPRYADGMFTSVQAGLAELGRLDGIRRIFVHPVDIPLVRADTVARIAWQAEEHGCTVVLPEFLGKSGHPPLIDVNLVPEICAWSGENGLQGLLDRHAPYRIPVADGNILLDMDTPAAYAEVLRRQARLHIPTPEEALEMLRLHGVPKQGVEHARAVAAVAVALCEALNARGHDLDPNLLEAAALLHDIAKGQARHEKTGGALLARRGFDRIADIVAAHKDMCLADADPLTEKELVYMADKLVRGPYRIALEQRFAEKIAQYQGDDAACDAIRGRLRNAQAMHARIEAELGQPIEAILQALNLEWV